MHTPKIEKSNVRSTIPAPAHVPWSEPDWTEQHAEPLRQAIHDKDIAGARRQFDALRELLSAHVHREEQALDARARFLPAETRDGACWIVKVAQDALAHALDRVARALTTPSLGVPSAPEGVAQAVDRLADTLSSYAREVERVFYGPLATGGRA